MPHPCLGGEGTAGGSHSEAGHRGGCGWGGGKGEGDSYKTGIPGRQGQTD